MGAATGLAIAAAAGSGPPGAGASRLGMPGAIVAVTGQSPSPAAPQSLSVLEAVLERITYANEDTGYTIGRVATERTGPDLLTVAGPLLGAQVGESLRLTGAGAPPGTAGSSRCTPLPPCCLPRSRASAATSPRV